MWVELIIYTCHLCPKGKGMINRYQVRHITLRLSILIMLVTTESEIQARASLSTLPFLHQRRALPILQKRGKHLCCSIAAALCTMIGYFMYLVSTSAVLCTLLVPCSYTSRLFSRWRLRHRELYVINGWILFAVTLATLLFLNYTYSTSLTEYISLS